MPLSIRKREAERNCFSSQCFTQISHAALDHESVTVPDGVKESEYLLLHKASQSRYNAVSGFVIELNIKTVDTKTVTSGNTFRLTAETSLNE